MAKKKKTTEKQPKAKEQKTKRELQAMARERLGCAVPVRRDANGGWYFQFIEVAGLNSGTLQGRRICSPRSCGGSMTLRSDRARTTARRAAAPPTLTLTAALTLQGWGARLLGRCGATQRPVLGRHAPAWQPVSRAHGGNRPKRAR